MVTQSDSVRLAPRWAVVVMGLSVLVLLVAGAVLATVSTGAERGVAIALGVAGACGAVFVVHGFWPRKAMPLPVAADGTMSVAAPVLQVGAALVGWLSIWVASGLFVFMAATQGLGGIDSPGPAVVVVGATLASTPDAIRLFTGRLHRWRLTWGPDGITYRGYRTAVELPPGSLRDVRLQASRLFRWAGVPERFRPREGGSRGYGVVLGSRGGRADVLVPQIFFREPAEQVADELRAAARRR